MKFASQRKPEEHTSRRVIIGEWIFEATEVASRRFQQEAKKRLPIFRLIFAQLCDRLQRPLLLLVDPSGKLRGGLDVLHEFLANIGD